MRLILAAALAVPATVVAHGVHAARNLNLPRQASSAASAPPASSGASSGTTPAASSTTLPSVSWSFISTNPTAVPVTAIVSGASSSPTLPPTTTFSPGASPTYYSNAPPLPDISTLNPANYPALDKPPPTDHPLVQQWIAQVNSSGIQIPNISPTVLGGCPANPQAAADQSRCWWTCGGCTDTSFDVTTCPDKLTWGLTYDDGPAFYTQNLLQYLDQVNLKSTFFVIGSRAISLPNVLREEYMSGHHIGVHTWSHPMMTTLTNEEVIAELGWTKKIIQDVLGVTPLYWRPPYGDIDNRVRAISKAMNLIPIMWTRISPTATFDTGDFNVAGGLESVTQVFQNWQFVVGNASTLSTGFIVLEHDLFQQSVEIATGYILPDALAIQPALKIQTVIDCLHKPISNAYIETNDNSSNPIPNPNTSGTGTSTGGGAQSSGSGSPSGGSSGSSSGGGSNSGAIAGVDSGVFAAAGTVALGLLAGLQVVL